MNKCIFWPLHFQFDTWLITRLPNHILSFDEKIQDGMFYLRFDWQFLSVEAIVERYNKTHVGDFLPVEYGIF